jgi:hypothetical protein
MRGLALVNEYAPIPKIRDKIVRPAAALLLGALRLSLPSRCENAFALSTGRVILRTVAGA